MKLQTKLLLATGAILAVITAASLYISYRTFEGYVGDEMAKDAKNITAMLMATKRVYHQQFIASGLPVTDQTVGFMPAYALSRIAKDFPNWDSQAGVTFNNVSDRPRNPSNRADNFELEAMAWFRANPKAKERIVEITAPDGKRYYHYTTPMYIEGYCLKCHGDRNLAPPSIRERYTEAFDYKVGDLRGVMSIKIPMATLREQFWSMWRKEFWVGMAGYLCMFLALGLMINRLVTLRLARLKKTTEQLRAGDYNQRVAQDGHDEISLLAGTMNQMADAIQKRDAELQEAEKRWRFALEDAGDGLWDWNVADGTVFFSRRWKEMLGFAENEIGNGLDEWEKRIHPDDKAETLATVQAYFDGKTPEYQSEHRVRCKDGSWKWILDRGMLVSRGGDGKPLRMIGTHADITGRKQAEALERQRFNELQAIYQLNSAVRDAESLEQVYGRAMESILLALEADRVSILLFDAAGVMRFVAWRGLSDTYRKAADGHSPWTQATVDPQPILVDDIELDAGWAHFLPVAKAEGISAFGFIPLVLRGHPIGKFMVYFNRPHHFTEGEAQIAKTIASHIAFAIERVRAEKNIRESEARYRTVVDNVKEVIFQTDAQGLWVFLNSAWEEVTGFPVGESLGHLFLDYVHPDDRQRNAELFEPLIQRKKDYCRHEIRYLTRGGGFCWIEVYARLGLNEQNEITGTYGTLMDITERKEYEEELKRSNAELEQFSYAVSHDMRQPLRMISSYLQLLEMSLAGQLDSEKRDYFNFAIEGAKRIDQMLTALLEYSRVGRVGEPLAWIESRAVLDEALQFLQPAIAEAQARLSIAGEWPRLLASHDEILRLLQNLIGNAVKYRIAGRIPEITVTGGMVRNEWSLCVADNCVGIIPNQIKQLFQVFQRLHSRTAYEGTGIGLALCRKIAEHHKGRIWAESAGEGQGSRFCVVLPVPQENTMPAKGTTT